MPGKHTFYDGNNVCRECGLNQIYPGENIRLEDELDLSGYMQLLVHVDFKTSKAEPTQPKIDCDVLIHLVHKFKYYKIN